MKKKIITAVSTLALISLLAGCFPSGKKPAATDTDSGNVDVGTGSVDAESNSGGVDVNSNENSFPSDDGEQQSIQLPENLSLNIARPQNTPSELPEITLSLKRWDKAEMEKLFLDGKEIEEKWENDSDFYPGEKKYGYDTKDQFRLVFGPGEFTIDDKAVLGGEYFYSTVYYYGYGYLSSKETLAAFSQENARGRVEAILDKLEITNYGDPVIVPIKADYANEILDSFKEDRESEFDYTPWTADEEIYVLYYPLVYEGVELTTNFFQLQQKEWATTDSKITAVVSKDKILRITARGIYSESYKSSESIKLNYNYDKALGELKKYFSNLILSEPKCLTSGKLVYAPYDMEDHATIIFKPTWEFSGYDETDYFPYKRECYEYLYADTGSRYMPR